MGWEAPGAVLVYTTPEAAETGPRHQGHRPIQAGHCILAGTLEESVTPLKVQALFHLSPNIHFHPLERGAAEDSSSSLLEETLCQDP